MANGNGAIGKVVGGLVLAFILGGVGLAIAQGRTAQQVETNQKAIEAISPAVQKVWIVENDIGHIKDEIDKIQDGQKEILRAIEKKHAND